MKELFIFFIEIKIKNIQHSWNISINILKAPLNSLWGQKISNINKLQVNTCDKLDKIQTGELPED